ncbi:S8 family serine peptidase [Streptacidiphilus monticola]
MLGVGASDRNDERAESFSESGTSVGVAAPGVDIVSTVPKRGQCVDSGTSFAAPYVAGVAALLKQMYPHWTPAQIIARIEQTAQRTDPGRNDQIGWGVVDPVAAVSDTSAPEDAPTPTPRARGRRRRSSPGPRPRRDPGRPRPPHGVLRRRHRRPVGPPGHRHRHRPPRRPPPPSALGRSPRGARNCASNTPLREVRPRSRVEPPWVVGWSRSSSRPAKP